MRTMQSKIIINLGRELGSGGRVIGERVAKALAINFYDKKLIKIASKQSGISDEIFAKVDEHSRRKPLATLVSYLKSPFAGGEAASNSVLDAESLFAIQSDVIRDIAERESALFVGRCADYILREMPMCINIFITANREDRIARISESYSVDEHEAEQMIESCDSSRAQYYNFYTTGEWGHASSYHLCINSSRLGIDGTVEFIVDFIKQANM